MKTYPASTAVTLTFPFVDLNGDPVTPSAVSARVLREHGTEIVPSFSVSFDPGDTEADVAIAAINNALISGQELAARVVELSMTTPAGTIPAVQTYLIRGTIKLTAPSNSFQTYEQALIQAATMTGLDMWNHASTTDDQRRNALLDAYRRLTRLGYRARVEEDQALIEDLTGWETNLSPRVWPAMTLGEYNTLPQAFRTALCRAQVIEANELLSVTGPETKRRKGILSESVGESSMMFRPGKPLDLGLSEAALRELTGFVNLRITIARS